MCVLEMLVHVDVEDAPDDLVAIPVTFPASLGVRVVAASSLPEGWRSSPSPSALAEIGNRWARAGRTALLSVPSAVVPREQDYVINPKHPAVARLRIGKPERFTLDPRLRAK